MGSAVQTVYGATSSLTLQRLQKQADMLKPDSEALIEVTQNPFGDTIKGKLKNGAFYEYLVTEKKVVIYKASDPECVT